MSANDQLTGARLAQQIPSWISSDAISPWSVDTKAMGGYTFSFDWITIFGWNHGWRIAGKSRRLEAQQIHLHIGFVCNIECKLPRPAHSWFCGIFGCYLFMTCGCVLQWFTIAMTKFDRLQEPNVCERDSLEMSRRNPFLISSSFRLHFWLSPLTAERWTVQPSLINPFGWGMHKTSVWVTFVVHMRVSHSVVQRMRCISIVIICGRDGDPYAWMTVGHFVCIQNWWLNMIMR